jgi:hypothetical protein
MWNRQLQHVGSLVVACWIFLIVTGRIFIVAWNLLNCGMWDLLCSMNFFFFFAACGILVVACRSYKLSHVGSLLQHARSFYFWHVGCFSCGMRNLLVAACGIISVVIHVIFIVVCGICVAA